jgi:positive regulator of sigma E activity
MRQEGVVTSVYEDGTADVAVERAAICGGDCSQCNGCIYEKKLKARAVNRIGAKPGMLVALETNSHEFYTAAVAVYVLPLIGLILGFLIPSLFHATQGICIAAAFILAAAGVLTASAVMKKRQKKNPVPSTITAILPRDRKRES